MPSLLPIFREKLIPWVQQDLDQRLVVARPVMKKSSVPYSAELTKKKIPGKRVIIRKRTYGNQRIYRARWPEAALHELDIPKLVCVTKGITDYQTGEYVVTCGEGHFILLPPLTPNTSGGRSHLEGEHRKNGACDLLQILIFHDSIQCRLCTSRGENHQEYDNDNCLIRHPQAVHLFNLFMEEALHGGSENSSLCAHLLSGFFLFLSREIKAGHHLNLQFNTPKSTFANSPMQDVRDYIKTHIREHLTIEKVAHQMYMSPSQFTRFIRRESGHSFVEVLTEGRLEEAKILLQETQWSVANISNLVGFKSHTYFNDLFRRHAGCTPGVYRRKKHPDKS